MPASDVKSWVAATGHGEERSAPWGSRADQVGLLAMDHASTLDDVFEMANLGERRTGIRGVICISSRQGAYSPYVKYFQMAGGNQPSFSVSIEDNLHLLISSLPDRVTNEMSLTVTAWVRLNAAALLKFWREGDTWPKEDVDAHIDSLKKPEP